MPNVGNPVNLDRFTYTLNNPLRYIDPSGHTSLCTGYWDSGCKKGHPTRTIIFSGSGEHVEHPMTVDQQLPVYAETDQTGHPVPDEYKVRYPGGNRAKYEQSLKARGLSPDTPVNLIGYSASTESVLMYAKWRIENDQEVNSIVLLDPTFVAKNETGKELLFGNSGNTVEFDEWSDYLDFLTEAGVDIAVYDTGFSPEAKDYRSHRNGSYQYNLVTGLTHNSGIYRDSSTNQSIELRNRVYRWMAEQY